MACVVYQGKITTGEKFTCIAVIIPRLEFLFSWLRMGLCYVQIRKAHRADPLHLYEFNLASV